VAQHALLAIELGQRDMDAVVFDRGSEGQPMEGLVLGPWQQARRPPVADHVHTAVPPGGQRPVSGNSRGVSTRRSARERRTTMKSASMQPTSGFQRESMGSRQRQSRSMEHVSDRQVLVIRWTVSRSPFRLGPARKRRQTESLRPHRFIDQ
jgi:hypothetical protein